MRGKDRKRRVVTIAITIIVCGVVPIDASAQYLSVYGGPTYSNSTGSVFSGYSGGSFGIGAVNQIPVPWDASTIIELGNLNGGSSGAINAGVSAANSSGTIAGTVNKYVSGVNKGLRTVRWDSSGTVTELGSLGMDGSGVGQSFPFAINESGVIVGTADKYVSGILKGGRAVRWDPSSTAAIELADPGTSDSDFYYSQALAINNAGIVAGYADKNVGGTLEGTRVIRWNASGSVGTELGILGTDASGDSDAYAHDINNPGTIVGYATKYIAGVSGGQRAVRWDASSSAAVELDNLGTDNNGKTSSVASAINDAGTIVGNAVYFVSGVSKGFRAARWDAGGTVITELGNLGTDVNGSTNCEAVDINNSGIAIGDALKLGSHSDRRAVMWGADGVAIDLNALIDPASGWVLSQAQHINNDGWITGIGTFDPDGAGPLTAYNRLFLLQVPEPTSMSLLFIGAMMLSKRRTHR